MQGHDKCACRGEDGGGGRGTIRSVLRTSFELPLEAADVALGETDRLGGHLLQLGQSLSELDCFGLGACAGVGHVSGVLACLLLGLAALLALELGRLEALLDGLR